MVDSDLLLKLVKVPRVLYYKVVLFFEAINLSAAAAETMIL